MEFFVGCVHVGHTFKLVSPFVRDVGTAHHGLTLPVRTPLLSPSANPFIRLLSVFRAMRQNPMRLSFKRTAIKLRQSALVLRV
jgi:hypothetical protein